MEQADIYYCNLHYDKLLVSLENAEVESILSRLNKTNDMSRLFPLKQTAFLKYWRNIDSTELVTVYEIAKINFNRLLDKYSHIETNPYSKLNDPKQKLIKKLISDHTEMTIGEILKIKKKFYIITTNGWKMIKFVK